jgi:hypothetical protein
LSSRGSLRRFISVYLTGRVVRAAADGVPSPPMRQNTAKKKTQGEEARRIKRLVGDPVRFRKNRL